MGSFRGKNTSIDPRKINVDQSYQREPSLRRIHQIADNFDELLFQRPVINRRADGKFYCVTGQHRLLGAVQAGRASVPIVLVDGMTREEEAHYFRQDAETTVRVPVASRFAAAIVEGDAEYVSIERTLNKWGYSAVNNDRMVQWTAINPAVKLSNWGVLDDTLALIRHTWSHMPLSKLRDGRLVRGVGEFVYTYYHEFDQGIFEKAMSHFDPDDLVRLASVNQAKAHPQGSYWVSAELVRQYNSNAGRGKSLNPNRSIGDNK